MAFAAEATAAFLYSAEPSITAVSSKEAQPKCLTITPVPSHPRLTALSISASATAIIFDEPSQSSGWTRVDQSIFQLLELCKLDSNWDGYHAAAPKRSSIEQARRFLRSLSSTSIIPEPTLHADGNAILFYKIGDCYAEIEFFDDGRAEFFASRGEMEWSDKFSLGGDVLPVGLREIGIST